MAAVTDPSLFDPFAASNPYAMAIFDTLDDPVPWENKRETIQGVIITMMVRQPDARGVHKK